MFVVVSFNLHDHGLTNHLLHCVVGFEEPQVVRLCRLVFKATNPKRGTLPAQGTHDSNMTVAIFTENPAHEHER